MCCCAGSTCSTASRTANPRQALPLFQRAIAARSGLRDGLCAWPRPATASASTAANRPTPTGDSRESERLSRLALTLDRFDPLALSLVGHIRSWLFRDYDQAIELFDRALAANPSSAIAWLRSSATFSYIGETREARRPGRYRAQGSRPTTRMCSSLRAGRAGELRRRRLGRRGPVGAPLAGGQSALRRQHALPSPPASRRAASSRRARAVGQTLLQLNPNFRVRAFAEGMPSRIPASGGLFGDTPGDGRAA